MSSTSLMMGILFAGLAGFGAWVAYLLMLQNGRLLLRVEALEERLNQLVATEPDAGLPIGMPAPDFELTDLTGNRVSLSQFRGRHLLLIFFNPHCGFCTQMAPQLALAGAGDGGPLPVVITSGSLEENRQLAEQHGIRCPVLIQEGSEVLSAYRATGTPTGYLIDPEGRIASEMAVGSIALFDLLPAPAAVGDSCWKEAAAESAGVNGSQSRRGNRSLADSKIARNGLTPGSAAPDFLLPRLDGGELSLQEYRGRRVLLVFSDPDCGPCDRLAPELERLHSASGLDVLMVSRGDLDANRAKAVEHGLSFPIVLQRQWEISRRYAMFATPIAYLIDEGGTVLTDVAVGAEAILALAADSSTRNTLKTGRACRCGKSNGACRCARKRTLAGVGT